MTALLEIRGLRKDFGGIEVLRGVDLQVDSGETVAICGPSGSGKSTLLRCINCLETPTGGSVVLDGELMGFEATRRGVRHLNERRIAQQRRSTGMVFQSFNLMPNWTVLRNVTQAPRTVGGLSRAEAEKRGLELLDRIGLASRAQSYPRELSGGQQQRVSIARALALRPKLLLFDEPTSALDPENVAEVTEVMRRLADDGATMIVVTHEMAFARNAASRIVTMRDGLVVDDAPTRPPAGAARTSIQKV